MDGALPVGLLAALLRELLEGDPRLADLWVEGEVFNRFLARSGHIYFTLRDGDGQIKCVLFRGQAQRQAIVPADGDQIAVHGGLTFYPPDGSTRIIVDSVQPAGIGLAALELARLRERLAAEGLFAPERKRPLPPTPKVIGVVTSPDGAVWHDIQTVLRRRYPLVEAVLSPAAVQGARAPESIVAALAALQKLDRCDVVIVARGGGSAEDLAAFNDERVVRAVFACRIPVVSGVGHETDWTLIDDVADVRAPTPSVAAEVCVPDMADLRFRIGDQRLRLWRGLGRLSAAEEQRFAQMRGRLRRSDPLAMIRDRQAAVAGLRRRGSLQTRAALGRADAAVVARRNLLQALEPAAVLRRGYAVVLDAASERPIARVRDAKVGREFIAELSDGAIFGRIEATSTVRGA
ncbi:MAG TPA: exodeoxyribonuclease VII large subunit [Thermomicrobiales bacterium]|nr:exodeoxyribonuclease VII large subunit [Thermomicrobiales bacterium]